MKDVYGDSYKENVKGVTRLGTRNNPTGYTDTDFTDDKIKAVYIIDNAGDVKLTILYPNPKNLDYI